MCVTGWREGPLGCWGRLLAVEPAGRGPLWPAQHPRVCFTQVCELRQAWLAAVILLRMWWSLGCNSQLPGWGVTCGLQSEMSPWCCRELWEAEQGSVWLLTPLPRVSLVLCSPQRFTFHPVGKSAGGVASYRRGFGYDSRCWLWMS